MSLGTESRGGFTEKLLDTQCSVGWRSAFWVLCLVVVEHTVGAQELVPESTWPPSYRQDANLFDVCFVTPTLGWAVGDRGTILHTQDGGQTWELQDCPVTGRLESVHFVDAQHGWAVGGVTKPYTHRSVGYVLRTRDGGRTWEAALDQFLPWLSGVHFDDAKRGVAYGIPSAMFPSAAYRTRDGGQHWTPWPGVSAGWVNGLFRSSDDGLLLERTGRMVRADSDSLVAQGRLEQESRLPLRITDNGRGQWLLCGNQGLVRISRDQGQEWLPPRGLPEIDTLSEFDWQAIQAIGEHAWIVGVPGSRVLTTHDSGHSWQLVPTGQQLPLYALEFLDSQHGWAVGALGTVMVTRDGGQSWSQQRSERFQLAVMGVFGQAEQIPWEMVAQLAAGEGYWTRIEVLADSPAIFSRSGQTPTPTRLHEATVMLGGVGANLIQAMPAPDPRLKLPEHLLQRQWNQITRTDSTAQLTEYLVRQLRTWQPELIVVPDAASVGDGLSHLTRRIVLDAIEKAADTERFTSQLQAGLRPWRVSRVTALTEDASGDGYPINRHQLVLSLGDSIGDLASRARAKLHASYELGPSRLLLRTLDGETPSRRGLFASRSAASGMTTRRANGEIAGDVRLRSQQAQRRRNLEVLLSDASRAQGATWQQAMHLASELPAQHRRELFMASASNSLRSGHLTVAYDLLGRLASDVGQGPVTEAARVRLFWYLASEEAAIHWPLPNPIQGQQLSHTGIVSSEPGQVRPATFSSPLTPDAGPLAGLPVVANGSAETIASNPIEARRRQAIKLVNRIQAEQPDLYFEPQLRFPLAALDRRTGRVDAAIKFWRSQMSGRSGPAYRSWAASELAILEPNGLPARPIWNCPRLPKPPRLDGRLTDPVWENVAATHLRSTHATASTRSGTRIRIAYDSEFLYLAVQADKIPTLAYTTNDQTRRRDELLDGDRIEVFLDVDRDAVTHWGLAIDYRGGASERLNEDWSWNPLWYVAAAQDESTWSLEAAMPLTSLSSRAVSPGVVWCVGIQRIIPQYDWETWLQTAPVEARPEEFGLLRFE